MTNQSLKSLHRSRNLLPPPRRLSSDERHSMIRKSGYRFSEKIMLKQQAKAKYRINLKSFRFRRAP